MKQIFQIMINSKLKTRSIFFVFGFLLFANVNMFGQAKEDNVLLKDVSNKVAYDLSTTETNKVNQSEIDSMNFLNWFMGTKQTPNGSNSNESDSVNAKAQIIQSGITPNRVLMKTFLKKTMNYNIAFV